MWCLNSILKIILTSILVKSYCGKLFNNRVFNMTDFIKESKIPQYSSKDRGNFTFIVNSKDFIYTVSNGNEILKLSKSSLGFIETHVNKMDCIQSDFCERRNINLLDLNKETNILWFCFAIKSLNNDVANDEVPVCHLTLEDSFGKLHGNWQAQTFTSSDFLHRTVFLTVPSYVYVGVHYFYDKLLHIFKNAQSFAASNIPIKPISVPQNFLKAPGEFILSFQHKYSVYFLLLETDFSCGFRNNQLQTRLLRICDSDPGNSNNEFNALAKITVQCESQVPSSNLAAQPFTIASAATWMSLSNQLVVSFISKKNEVPASVLCIYSIKSIEDAFNSNMKKASEKPIYNTNSFPDTCTNLSSKISNDQLQSNIYITSKNYPLRRTVLTNVTIFDESDLRIIHLSSDESIWTSYQRLMLFLGVEYENQSAVILISLEPKFCILEKYLMTEKITTLELKQDGKSSLYIGTSNRLIGLPMDRCENYKTKEQCASFFNPYCGWNSGLLLCAYIAKEIESKYFIQTLTSCPYAPKDAEDITRKSDVTCPIFSVTDPLKSIGTCTCRLTKYNPTNPDVKTDKICKVDGDWSPFSDWSDCSATCGSGYQSRTRNCDSPIPRNEGKQCKGLKLEMRPCEANIECKKSDNTIDQLGLFSQWSSWSACSSTCGYGFQIRSRRCVSTSCTDNDSEKRLCTLPLCKRSITSEWTRWSKFNQHDLTKRRLRAQCFETYFYKSSSMAIEMVAESNRTEACHDDQCFERKAKNVLGGHMTLWSQWSECSVSCGVGIKQRHRQCSNNNCIGSTTDYSKCNTDLCLSTWSCWSNWEGCSTVCETPKIKTRHRSCIGDWIYSACSGHSSEKKECDLIPCSSSYSQWSMWTSCRVDGIMVRTRKCKSKRQCLLPLMQSKPCARASTDKPALYSSIYMIVSGIVGLLVGVFVASFICYLWYRCTMRIIRKTNSGSFKNSNPLHTEDQYHSQSLNTIPDTGSSIYRQRSTSNSDSNLQMRYLPPFRDDTYDYTSQPTFFDPSSAFRRPLPDVQEL